MIDEDGFDPAETAAALRLVGDGNRVSELGGVLSAATIGSPLVIKGVVMGKYGCGSERTP